MRVRGRGEEWTAKTRSFFERAQGELFGVRRFALKELLSVFSFPQK